ncbi:MAG TPA: hypothetical protein VIO16_07255, partial [Dehalococcoidia bacterium]
TERYRLQGAAYALALLDQRVSVADVVHLLGCDVVPSDVWDIPVIGWVPTRRLPARVHKLLR